jgi:hypothetical protein
MMGSRRARITVTGVSLAAVLLATSGARAEPSAADRETARSMMQEGRDLRDKNDLKGALARFKAADDIMHVPTTALEVARTQAALGLLVEALDTVATLHKVAEKPDDPQPFKDARAKADELDAQIEAKVPSVTITVTGAAEGDTPAVSIDGSSLPTAAVGLPRKVDPGHHVITAHAASGDAKEEIDVAEGDKKDVALTLGAGGNPGEAAPAEAGNKDVVHTPSALTYTSGVVAGVGLIAGTVTGLMSLSKASTVKSECTYMNMMQCLPGQQTSDLNSGKTLATISTVSFIVAGAGAGVAIASLIIGHKAPGAAPASAPPPDNDATPTEPGADPAAPAPQSRIQVTPWIGAGSAGVFGTF